jgi:hypothetical protein
LNRERARQDIAGPLVAAETTRTIGDNAIPAPLTCNPLISLETAKEKSLQILGKVWKSLDFPWNFLGKVWKSSKKLGAAAAGYAAPR